MTEVNDDVLLTVNDAALRVGVSRRTIYNWLKEGKLRSVRTAGGGNRIFASSLYRPQVIAEAPLQEG